MSKGSYSFSSFFLTLVAFVKVEDWGCFGAHNIKCGALLNIEPIFENVRLESRTGPIDHLIVRRKDMFSNLIALVFLDASLQDAICRGQLRDAY